MPSIELIIAGIAGFISIIALVSTIGTNTITNSIDTSHSCPSDAECEVLTSGQDAVYVNVSSDPGVDAIYFMIG